MSRKSFTPKFKQECVELVIRQGYQVKQAAISMGVGLSTLQRWLRQYHGEQKGMPPKASAINPEQRKIQELEPQVKQLKSDNNLFKKASAFFAIEMSGSKSR
ncbi:transposase [Providencia stuartii]|uniref:transposase n=1 Tax=Providencia stuartii TaxID=588 RepID=UPI00111DEF5D|nr:transposase [Providencia stuartii]